jgi:hypothetical protein
MLGSLGLCWGDFVSGRIGLDSIPVVRWLEQARVDVEGKWMCLKADKQQARQRDGLSQKKWEKSIVKCEIGRFL